MKHARNDLTVEGAVELPRVVEYLEQLVQALKSGAAHVRQGDQEVVLGPRGVIGFSLAASDRGKRQRLALELTWRKFKAPDPSLDLHIAAAPAAAPVAGADAVEVAASGDEAPGASAPTGAPGTEARGEAHEGEGTLHTADVYMHNPRGSNNRSDE